MATERPIPSALPNHATEILHVGTFDKNFGIIEWIGWSPNSTELAISYEQDNKIRILDAKSGQLKFTIAPPAAIAAIRSISWSPNGRFLACAVIDPVAAIYIWDLSSGVPKIPIEIPHTGQRPNFSWSPDSQHLVSVGAFGEHQDQWNVFVWEAASGTQIAQFTNTGDPIVKVFWSPDDRTFATLTENEQAFYALQIRDAKTLQILAQFPNNDRNLVVSDEVSWKSDGTKLVGGLCSPITGICTLWIWNVLDNQLSKPFQKGRRLYDGNVGPFTYMSLNPKRNVLAINDLSGANYLWDVNSGILISSLDDNPGSVTSLSWSPDGNLLATGNTDGSMRIWRID